MCKQRSHKAICELSDIKHVKGHRIYDLLYLRSEEENKLKSAVYKEITYECKNGITIIKSNDIFKPKWFIIAGRNSILTIKFNGIHSCEANSLAQANIFPASNNELTLTVRQLVDVNLSSKILNFFGLADLEARATECTYKISEIATERCTATEETQPIGLSDITYTLVELN